MRSDKIPPGISTSIPTNCGREVTKLSSKLLASILVAKRLLLLLIILFMIVKNTPSRANRYIILSMYHSSLILLIALTTNFLKIPFSLFIIFTSILLFY
jgi:hypothetical protein